MNFLAHAYLSGEDEKVLVGNFVADFVKGKQALQAFEQGIVKGIELHRFIDQYTDSHPIVKQSKSRLRQKYRHYSGVIVDVFYDHFLAREWHAFSQEPLDVYSKRVYSVIQRFEAVLPHDALYMLPYMVKGNWLLNYAKIEGIHRSLTGMSQRTPFLSRMEEASQDLERDYDLYQAEFFSFFAALIEACDEWQRKHL